MNDKDRLTTYNNRGQDDGAKGRHYDPQAGATFGIGKDLAHQHVEERKAYDAGRRNAIQQKK